MATASCMSFRDGRANQAGISWITNVCPLRKAACPFYGARPFLANLRNGRQERSPRLFSTVWATRGVARSHHGMACLPSSPPLRATAPRRAVGSLAPSTMLRCAPWGNDNQPEKPPTPGDTRAVVGVPHLYFRYANRSLQSLQTNRLSTS